MDMPVNTLLDKKGHEVYSIQPQQSVFEAIQEMDARDVGGLIVKTEHEVVGIITERDYLRKVMLKGRSSKETPVESIMTRNFVSIAPEESVARAMALMTAQRCRHLPVFEAGQLVGIISVGDLVKAVIAEQQFTIKMLEDYISGR